MKSLEAVFRPRSIAVIGASANRNKLGNVVLRSVVHGDFTGPVYPVNPRAEVVYCIQAYKSVLETPGEVDLAIVVVPRKVVIPVVEECVEKGVGGIVVITAGFKETGEEGARIERKLAAMVREAGIRMVGPNCMGVINTESGVRMNATFSEEPPLPGKTSLISQSGALGLAIISYSHQANVGLSKFISLGNKADVSSNDVLQFLENDPETDLILLYVESVGNPRRFVEVARRTTRKKPIVAVKSGRTAVGARAASSHTGALAGLDIAYDALFEQCGIIRANTIEEMFDIAKVMSEQPSPQNEEVIILSNGGGPAILAADALAGHGIPLPETSQRTKDELREFVVGEASFSNPIDMTGNATPEDFGRALDVLCRNERAGTILVIFLPIRVVRTADLVDGLVRVKKACPEKLILACIMAEEHHEGLQLLREAEIPFFTYPESAATALACLNRHLDRQSRPIGIEPRLTVDRGRAEAVFERARKDGRRLLTVEESLEVFSAYGITTIDSEMVGTEDEAVAAAERIGYPVALKLVSPKVVHKTEAGAVTVDIRREGELREAYRRIVSQREGEVEGVLVQAMVKKAREMIIGVAQDAVFGPLIMFGLGGIYVEVLKDVTFRLLPLTDMDAGEMVRSVKAHRLLEGVRGEPPSDVEALKDALLRVSALVRDFHAIRELDINPLMVMGAGEGAVAVDGRILLAGNDDIS